MFILFCNPTDTKVNQEHLFSLLPHTILNSCVVYHYIKDTIINVFDPLLLGIYFSIVC